MKWEAKRDVYIPKRSHHSSCYMAFSGFQELSQSKVGNFGIEVVVDQDVTRLYVTVDDFWLNSFMQIRETAQPTSDNI